jgi:hypothetical protein
MQDRRGVVRGVVAVDFEKFVGNWGNFYSRRWRAPHWPALAELTRLHPKKRHGSDTLVRFTNDPIFASPEIRENPCE